VAFEERAVYTSSRIVNQKMKKRPIQEIVNEDDIINISFST
jgi:hypothetical protein